MNTSDMNFTMTYEQHEFLLDLVNASDDLYYLMNSHDEEKRKVIDSLKDMFRNAWSHRFEEL